jgi:hypothetical protein
MQTLEKLIERGVNATSGPVADSGSSSAAHDAAVPTDNAPPTIFGPAAVAVGVPAIFTVDLDGVTLAAEPASAAVIEAQAGTTRKFVVTSSSIGAFRLIGTAAVRQQGELLVAAMAPPPSGSVIVPIIGSGWGSVIVAIVVAAVTAALGAVGVLGGQAIATILGALVGYVVARGGVSASSETSGSNHKVT